MKTSKENASSLKCGFCGADCPLQIAVLDGGLTVLRCRCCTADFAARVGRKEAVSQLVGNELYDGFAAGQRSARHWAAYVNSACKRLEWQTNLGFPGRKLSDLTFLDIGCGGGHLVAAARELGFAQALGTEADRVAAQAARQRDLDIYVGAWPVPELAARRFDLISLMHVLEHTLAPGLFLDQCLRCLAPGGMLTIDVPDQGSLPSYVKRVLRRIGRRRNEYGYVQPPWHLYGFRWRSFDCFAEARCLEFVWRRRTSPLDRTVFPHMEDYWSGRFRWNRRLYWLTRTLGQGGHLCLAVRCSKQ